MKIYKVEIAKLSYDWGRFEGWKVLGYYTTKAKAEQVAKEAYENRCPIDTGKTQVTEIEVEE